MSKKFTVLLFLLFIVFKSLGQISVNATVMDKFFDIPLPGATVLEKGTKNGVSTDSDGKFLLTVQNENSILQISHLGHQTKEIKVSEIENSIIELKTDCAIDWFDSKKIGLVAKSGIINNPFGGEFKISSPIIFGSTPIVGKIGYQTDFKENSFLNAQLSFLHLFVDCKFNADINFYHFKIDARSLDSKEYKAETSLNFNSLSIIVGYSYLEKKENSEIDYVKRAGLILGAGYFIGRPFNLNARGNINIYKNLITYQAQIKKQHKDIYGFVRYHNLDTFNEVSIGIGTEFGYNSRRQLSE